MLPGLKADPGFLHTALLLPDRLERPLFYFYSTLIPTFQRSPLSNLIDEQFSLLLLFYMVAWILSRIFLAALLATRYLPDSYYQVFPI